MLPEPCSIYFIQLGNPFNIKSDILLKLQMQWKHITLCKIYPYMGSKGNEESKQSTNISRIIIT